MARFCRNGRGRGRSQGIDAVKGGDVVAVVWLDGWRTLGNLLAPAQEGPTELCNLI